MGDNSNIRIGGLFLGEQGSGKTTRQRLWTDKLIGWARYQKFVLDSVFVFDRLREEQWIGAGPVCYSVSDYDECCYAAMVKNDSEHDILPRRIVFQSGMDPMFYLPFLRLAVEQGNVLCIFCEASDWFPSYKGQWPIMDICEGVTLDTYIRAGRHVTNKDGVICNCHYLTDTQESKGIHPLLRNQSNFVACGPIEGENNLSWIRDNFGSDGKAVARKAQSLGHHEWLVLRDKLGPGVPRPELWDINKLV